MTLAYLLTKEEFERHLIESYPTLYAKLADTNCRSEPITAYGIECGRGWWQIVDELSARIYKINKTVYVQQVKQKFGELRVYLSEYTPEINAVLSEFEKKADTTCEACGKPGVLEQRGWWAVVCGEHKEKKRNG